MQFYMIFGVVLVNSPIIPVTNFQFVTNILWDKDRNEENTYMLLESLFKGLNAYFQCNSMILSGFSWFHHSCY